MSGSRQDYVEGVSDLFHLTSFIIGTSNTYASGVAEDVNPELLFKACQELIYRDPRKILANKLFKISGKSFLPDNECNPGQRSVLVKFDKERKISEIYVMDRSLRIDLFDYDSVTGALGDLGYFQDYDRLDVLQHFSQANTVSVKYDAMRLYFAAGTYGRLKVAKKYSFNNKGGLKSEEQSVVKIESLENSYRTVVDYGRGAKTAKLNIELYEERLRKDVGDFAENRRLLAEWKDEWTASQGDRELVGKLRPGSRHEDLENELRVGKLLYSSLDGGRIGNKFYVLQKQGISYKNDYFKSLGDQGKIQQTLADLLIVRELYRLERKGYLHNDFKEANVIFFLDEDKNIKGLRLIDFGMASKIGGKCPYRYTELAGYDYFAPELRRNVSSGEERHSWTERTQMYQVLHEVGIDITKYPELAKKYSRWEAWDGDRPCLEQLYEYLRISLKKCSTGGYFEEITERFDLPDEITSVDLGREAKAGATRVESEAAATAITSFAKRFVSPKVKAKREAAAAAGENLNIVQGASVFERGKCLKIILNTLIANINSGPNLQHNVMVAQQFIKELESNNLELMTNTCNPFKFCVRKCTSFWKESSRQSALTILKGTINGNTPQEGNSRELTQ
jgi:serine/threonine protein kinase